MDNSFSADRFLEERVTECKECGGSMIYKGSGRYCCEECDWEFLTDFGKIKRYIEENGPSNAIELSVGTGVSRRKISSFLQDGRMEVAPNSEAKQFCLVCGKAIRTGAYCPECAMSLEKERRQKSGVYNVLADGNMQGNSGEMRFSNRWEAKGEN